MLAHAHSEFLYLTAQQREHLGFLGIVTEFLLALLLNLCFNATILVSSFTCHAFARCATVFQLLPLSLSTVIRISQSTQHSRSVSIACYANVKESEDVHDCFLKIVFIYFVYNVLPACTPVYQDTRSHYRQL